MYRTIGIIGCGLLGSAIYHEFKHHDQINIAYLYDIIPDRAAALDSSLTIPSLTDPAATVPDLIIETAVSSVIAVHGPRILTHTNLVIFSITALADEQLLQTLTAACTGSGTAMYIPHGAIAGLDAIQDGRSMLTAVTVTTRKPPASLSRSDADITVLYDGPTRGICSLFPRNVNIHAATALAGLGFDRTRSRLISDPGVTCHEHTIDATGDNVSISIQLSSQAGTGVSGAYTPASACSVIHRICKDNTGMIIF